MAHMALYRKMWSAEHAARLCRQDAARSILLPRPALARPVPWQRAAALQPLVQRSVARTRRSGGGAGDLVRSGGARTASKMRRLDAGGGRIWAVG
jgi:hypothetical protein